jgi:hypothetical protein
MMHKSVERVLKKEDKLYCASRKGLLGAPKGSLVLSESELYFIDKKGIRLFVVPIEDILSINAGHAFGAGVGRLVIKYRTATSDEVEEKIEHRSTSSALTLGILTRLQNPYFSSWEQTINEVRFGQRKENNDYGVEALEKLANLRDRGVLTEEEFLEKKRAILK